MIVEKTVQIKKLSNSVKTNFIDIGNLLKEIRDKEIYLEKYNTFTEYLESNEFMFCRNMAYKLIKVAEEYPDVERIQHLPLRTIIQLAYVPDRELREELDKEAVEVYQKKEKINEFYNKVKRSAKRTKETVTEGDSAELKCERILKQLINDIKIFNKTKEELNQRIAEGKKFSKKYQENNKIQLLIQDIERELEE